MSKEEPCQERIKYRLEGLCCANCAMKIEKAFCAEDAIGQTTLNFATQTVYLPPAALELAQRIVDRIEPGVILKPLNQLGKNLQPEEDKSADKRQQIMRMLFAGILLGAGLLMPVLGIELSLVLKYTIFLAAYFAVGYEVLFTAFRNLTRGAVFDENFLMSIGTIGAIAINQLPEAVGVMLFYTVGEYIQDLAVNRSRHSIQALMNIRPDYANLLHQLDVIKVAPEEVQVGQWIMVRPGEKVPLDGEVVKGSSFLDTSALTGESVPRRVEAGDAVLSGMVNTSGVLTIQVTRPYAESSVQKILDLVENASSRKAPTEKFITAFSRYYTPAIVVIALLIAIVPPLLGAGVFREWIYRALTILVISCPCALVISVPLGYFGGIGGASRHGVLVKGANFLESLTKVKTVVFDKTGTLTQGVFEVVEINPAEGYSPEFLLETAAAAEIHSSHPIAKSICTRYGLPLEAGTSDEYREVSGKGIQAKIKGQEVLVGKQSFLQEAGIPVPDQDAAQQAGTLVYVAVSGCYAGYLLITDRIKSGAKETIKALQDSGIKTVMLTGDHEKAAQSVAGDLGVSEFYADLLPEDKVACLEKLMEDKDRKEKVVFVGDGINDAPVLTRADVGMAMGGLGSDAAIEAADVVLMEDQPAKLLTAIGIAKYTKKIIWQNIIFALGIKLGFVVFGALGMATMWEAVFADVGVAVLAVLNAARVRQFSGV
ncbi:heavy metal-translocating P-type ATPase, Cd/Co/Hg/Pb/Zn-transporting [Desulfosporosinus orientis DSM 765]|uniref:Cd(2+)-exporting ATPase n=1 Tax=Desulfosporosinus orientis (strain ATCC 19365 / DSM 765 / NCIMB 8382 / VKM B-1628 / Singapore I) TaxID=768706 RepID=G7WAV5_DESOD|nr:heavy metal translocating P-type ATPase [Desulfosporosinus orientis]AET67166.1 heavy metal-translocating P-type ATPase, Cd/Co/Hg/Pb/Zn-transporting [Desulfosporosinus orientis DSM 765]